MMRLLTLIPALALLWAMPVIAAQDSAMQSSLEAFFNQGVVYAHARAELVEVLKWPVTTGALHWSLPTLHGHPARTILIAEQTSAQGNRRWNVPVRLHWWTRAIVADRDLPTGTILSKSLMRPARADIAGHRGSIWQQPHALIGARLTRSVRGGEILSSRVVSMRPIMRRGQQVTILASMDGIRVRTRGVAMQKGSLGSQIRVRNSKSREILQANVLDAHTVRVYAGGEG